jgi:2-(1,2-epoxy-1,2-dihydrophenyl)acetyl-CoA isomerase
VEYTTILTEKKDGILKITLNLPDKLNALDLVMREELKDAFLDARNDKSIKVVVVTGAGKAFCAGGDITTMQGIEPPAGRDRLKNVQQLVRLMVELEKPVIASVNGFATGAGLHIALACDMIIASEKAKFRESFVMIGLIPDMAGFYFLPQRIGLPRAKELMMTGRMLNAEEASSMGLVNRVVPHEELEKETMELAQQLAKGPGRAYAMIKSALNLWPASLQTLMEVEANLQAVAFATKDFDEGRQAFLDKREAKFTGE